MHNCRRFRGESASSTGSFGLTVAELVTAEKYWVTLSQRDHFSTEITALKTKHRLSSSSCLLSLHPFLDSEGVLRVGGRGNHSKLLYSKLHPIILHGKHPITKLIVRSEHLRMLHAGPTLLSSSLSYRFSTSSISAKTVRSITRQCVTCRRHSARPQPQMFGAATTRACDTWIRVGEKSE